MTNLKELLLLKEPEEHFVESSRQGKVCLCLLCIKWHNDLTAKKMVTMNICRFGKERNPHSNSDFARVNCL